VSFPDGLRPTRRWWCRRGWTRRCGQGRSAGGACDALCRAGGKRLRGFLVLEGARMHGVRTRGQRTRRRRSRRCMPIRWCMTTCPAWTTTTCAAASPRCM
jgi:hypothetical protein